MRGDLLEFLLVIIYTILTLTFLIVLKKRNKQNKFAGAYSGFISGYIFFYLVIPILVKLNISKMESRYIYIAKFVSKTDIYKEIIYLIIIIMGFVFFHFSYRFSNQKKLRIVQKLDFNSLKKYNNIFSRWGIVTFIIGGGSFLIFISSFGGISRVLSIAELNRSFNVTLSEFGDYRFSLFSIPARIITVTPFLYMYLILNRKKTLDKILFFISFIMSILFYLFNAGRAPLLSFLLVFVYYFSKRFFKRGWISILLAGIIFLPILDYLDNFFFYLSHGLWLDVKVDYIRYIYQFSFPFMTSLNITDITSAFGFRFGIDFVTAFLNFIPGVNFPISYEVTSQFFNGDNWRLIGGIPNDFLAFSYLQISILSVIMLSSIAGFIYGKIDIGLSLIPNNSSKYLITSIITIYSFFLIQSADFEPLIRGGVILLVTALIVLRIKNYQTYRSN